jgi:hypothetical protein
MARPAEPPFRRCHGSRGPADGLAVREAELKEGAVQLQVDNLLTKVDILTRKSGDGV